MEQRSATVRISDSDIDFDDVYGGPPMWTRYSYGGSRMKSCEEPPTGSAERPVFGEAYSSSRRRTSDDILKRSNDFVRSPRFSSPTPRSLSHAKMTKAVDITVFGSNVHAQNNYLSRFSSPAPQILINNSGQSTGQTLLSGESSSVKESLYSTRSTEKDVDHKSMARTGSSSTEFHFSMHKWANVGVPSLMSLHEGKHAGTSKVSGLSTDSMQDINLVSRTSLMESIKKELLVSKQEVKSSLLHDEIERKGYEEAGTKGNMETGTKGNMEKVCGKKKLEAKKMNFNKKAEANKPGVGLFKNRVKDMVKDLLRKSNLRKSSKNQNQDTNVEMIKDASRITSLAHDLPAQSVKIAPDASLTIPLDSKVPADDVNMMPDASFLVKEETERYNKQKSARNRTIRRLEDIKSHKDSLPASSDSVPNGSQASAVTKDEPSLDHYWVEELDPVESEAITALDSEIHTWSSGRTGNIRSLLSTLQLVLGAESGWKPVALVDIIETNALKKSYHRAMLCLHPDKLQQKGIDSHKKYIAEKVLDILQEAWDHWNLLDGAIF